MELAIQEGHDYVVCGHIHQPKIRGYENEEGSVIYMNSGDWVENLTSLEYDGEEWSLYRYETDALVHQSTNITPMIAAHPHHLAYCLTILMDFLLHRKFLLI
mgnify:FL=1